VTVAASQSNNVLLLLSVPDAADFIIKPSEDRQLMGTAYKATRNISWFTDRLTTGLPHSVSKIIYKSLFTENSVATQKQYSTSIKYKQNTKYNDQVHHIIMTQ